MNGLEEIQECIKNFIYEKQYIKTQIAEIEQKRTELAEKRNEMKKSINDDINAEINELASQISELGNQSQELQNKLDFSLYALKAEINLIIDNLVSEGIRKIRKIEEEIHELEGKVSSYEERNAKYELQKQEFYLRFGRMPELSENAIKESKLQEKETLKNRVEIRNFTLQIELIQQEITELGKIRKEFLKGNWDYIINPVEEIRIEEIEVEELGTIPGLEVEEFGPVEELYVEEFKPIEELQVAEFNELEEEEPIEIRVIKETDEEIEKIARAIVEEIVTEQETQNSTTKAEDIITFEEKEEKKEKVIIPLFGQKATISNITIKIEDGELVYKAQMSDEEEIKVHPSKISKDSVLLRDKQNRKECQEILEKYSKSEYKVFDKKVINKIDPLICELLIECAEIYSYDAQELIYNYAMSFANTEELDTLPTIIYNLCYIEDSKLSRKEKSIINKICKNARKNNRIEIIESFTGFRKFKYILKRIFAVNNVNVLPEAKY